jgi:drug/metabolite transporter (DMT)-like permease
MNSNFKVHGALLSVALIYGANYSIAKQVMPEYIQPFGFILIRVIVATTLFWLFHFINKKEEITSRKDLIYLFWCSIFGVSANQLLFFGGLNLTSPINASLIMTIVPIIVLGVSAIWLKERLTGRKIAGIILGCTGAILLLAKSNISFENQVFVGDVLIFLNASSFAIFLVMIKPLMLRYSAITISKWLFLFGTIVVIPFGVGEFSQIEWQSFNYSIWLMVAYVAILSTFVAYLLNAWALKFVNSSVVGVYIYLQPVFATTIAISIGQDELTLRKLLLALLIFSGVFLVSYKRKN